MHISDLQKYIRELSTIELFKAERYLEEEMVRSYAKDLMGLNVNDSAFQLKYARLQGQLEALRELDSKRNLLINSERLSDSVNNRGK